MLLALSFMDLALTRAPFLHGLSVETAKPDSSTRSPRCNAAFIVSNNASTAISAFFLGTPVLSI